MADPTEGIRRTMVEAINAEPGSREDLEAQHGKVWDTTELSRDFTVTSFMAPFVGVVEKSSGKSGLMMFQHHPRFYWGFKEA